MCAETNPLHPEVWITEFVALPYDVMTGLWLGKISILAQRGIEIRESE